MGRSFPAAGLNPGGGTRVQICMGAAAILAAAWLAQDPAPDPAELVRALGAEEHAERDRAERALREIGLPARDAVAAAAADDPDPEIRERAARLLRRPPFLLVDPALARAVAALDSASDPEWHAAVEAALGHGRDDARDALEALLPALSKIGRPRAEQLLAVLNGPAANGLLYGIVVSRPDMEKRPAGVEIWINVSDRELGLEDNMGRHRIRVLEAEEFGRVGGGSGCGGRYRPIPTFTLAPGGARVKRRSDFFRTDRVANHGGSSSWRSGGPGRYLIRTEYESRRQPEADPESAFWEGVVVSNGVECFVR
jgi:hypothetical protein